MNGKRGDDVTVGSRGVAYAQLALSMLIVGLCVTLGKMAVEHVPVVALAGVRCLSAAVALWPLARFEPRPGPMGASERRDLVLQTFFGVFAFTLLMLGGVQRTGAAEAGLIAATMPLAILVLALPLLGEGLSARAVLAALIASLGIAVLTFAGSGSGGGGASRALGNALVAAAIVAEALYTIFAKRLADRLPPATMAVRLNLVALLFFAPLLVLQPWARLLAETPAHIWLIGILYGVGTSGVALILWYRGTRRVRGGTAGLFTVFLPVGAILSAAFLLGEEIGARHLIGGVVIATALAIGLAPLQRGMPFLRGFRPRA